jgi:hypothetical protein
MRFLIVDHSSTMRRVMVDVELAWTPGRGGAGNGREGSIA